MIPFLKMSLFLNTVKSDPELKMSSTILTSSGTNEIETTGFLTSRLAKTERIPRRLASTLSREDAFTLCENEYLFYPHRHAARIIYYKWFNFLENSHESDIVPAFAFAQYEYVLKWECGEVLRLHIRYLNTSTSLLSFSFWKNEDSQKLFTVLIFGSC